MALPRRAFTRRGAALLASLIYVGCSSGAPHGAEVGGSGPANAGANSGGLGGRGDGGSAGATVSGAGAGGAGAASTAGTSDTGGSESAGHASGGQPSSAGAGDGGAPARGGMSGIAGIAGVAGVAGEIAAGMGGRVGAGGATQEAGGGAGAAAGSGGAPSCPGLICEDFESGSVDATKWDSIVKTGTVTVQNQRAAHGKYALLVHGQAGSSDDWAILEAKNVPAALQGAATFGRAYFYLSSEATASIHIQMAFAGRDGAGSGTGPAPFTKLRYMEVASYSGAWQLGFDLLDVSPTVEEVAYSKNRIPTNAWTCLEWQFEDHPDRVTVWIAGTEAGTFDNTDVAYASPGPVPPAGGALYDGTSSDIVGGFQRFGFGFHDWHPQKAFDLYYDDLALDSKRIGCLAADAP